MYVPRYLESHVLRLSASFPAVLVTGPRQVGKTTLLRRLGDAQGRGYVSLDELGPRTLANDDPDLFLQRYPAPLLVDEVQNAPPLLTALKPALDRRGDMGSYWLTGSQHFPLMRRVSESLAGRVAVVELAGLSQSEEARAEPSVEPFRPGRSPVTGRASAGPSELLPLFQRLLRGSFPRFAQPNPPPVDAYLGSYLETYVERDVRSMLEISDLATFRRFLTVAAARVGQLLNLSDLARDVGIAPSTAKEWIALLEATFQIYLLRPYFENIGKRQIKSPKLYFREPALAAYLTGWTSPEAAAAGAMAGPLFESYVLAELLKSFRHRGRQAPIYFYRTKEKREVDFLIAEDGQLFPIEVKLSAAPSNRDLKGIEALARSGANVGPGALVCMVREGFPLTETVDAMPVSAIA
ncbi:MAG: ATP-binding protein [Acidobacteriota bacterium]